MWGALEPLDPFLDIRCLGLPGPPIRPRVFQELQSSLAQVGATCARTHSCMRHLGTEYGAVPVPLRSQLLAMSPPVSPQGGGTLVRTRQAAFTASAIEFKNSPGVRACVRQGRGGSVDERMSR